MSKLVKKYLSPNSGVQYTGFDWWNRKPMTDYEDIINEPLPYNAPKSKGSPTLNRVRKALNNLVNAPVLPTITGSAPTLGTNTYGSTIGKELGVAAAGASSIAAPAIAATGALAPGSAFWTHPLTLQTILGTLGGEALNLASRATTGNTWGLGVGSVIGLTGWNPNNYALGRIATDMTNPGYFFSPTKFNFLTPGTKLPSSSLFLSRPKITVPGINTPMELFIETGDLKYLEDYIPKLARETNTPEVNVRAAVRNYLNNSGIETMNMTPAERSKLIHDLGYKWDESIDLSKLLEGVRNPLEDYHYYSLNDDLISSYIDQLKTEGINLSPRSARKILARGFADPSRGTKTIGSYLDTFTRLPKDNVEKYLSPDILSSLKDKGLSPSTLRYTIGHTYIDAPSGKTIDYIDALAKNLTPEQLTTLDEMANFSMNKGFTHGAKTMLTIPLTGVQQLHPNIPRPGAGQLMVFKFPDGGTDWLTMRPSTRLINGEIGKGDAGAFVVDMPTSLGYLEVPIEGALKTSINNLVKYAIEHPFSVAELTGESFSSSSMPMIWRSGTRIMNGRAANGQFPGMIIPRGGTVHGNEFGNVNLGPVYNPDGTVQATASIASGIPYGRTPSVEEILTYPTRKQARDFINLNAARTYKAALKHRYPGAPDYGFDEGLLDLVIKAQGDIDAVPGAARMMFNDGRTPLWTLFPETSESPIYPNVSFFFNKGGKLIDKPSAYK